MQNPITLLPIEASGNAAKQVKNNASSGESAPNSFKQVLSKEISEKQNVVQEKPPTKVADKVADKVENKAAPQDIKKNISDQPTRIEAIAEDESKNDISSSESAQTGGVQLIALVESLAQFSPKTTEKSVAVTSAEVPSIDTNAASADLSKTANVAGLTTDKSNLKTDPKVAPQDKFSITPQLPGEIKAASTENNTLTTSSSAERLIAPELKVVDGQSITSAQITTKPGLVLTSELKATASNAGQTDPRTDLKVNFQVDMQADPQAGLKQNLQADLKIDLKSDLKTDPKTDLSPGLKTLLSGDLKTDVKSELKTDPKIDLKTGPKIDTKTDFADNLKTDVKANTNLDRGTDLSANLKTDLKTDSKITPKIDLKTDLKTELKVDAKAQDAGSIKEQNVKIAEISPSAQNYAQQISVSNAQINVAAEIEHIAPRLGTAAWNQSVGQKVVWMVAGGQQTAELTLNPPDLGPMQVVLSVNNDQANATFISAHPDVRDALESALPKLRQMMNDAGVQLSGFSVKSESSNSGAQFTGEQSSFRSPNRQSETASSAQAISATTNTKKSSAGSGIVDTFA